MTSKSMDKGSLFIQSFNSEVLGYECYSLHVLMAVWLGCVSSWLAILIGYNSSFILIALTWKFICLVESCYLSLRWGIHLSYQGNLKFIFPNDHYLCSQCCIFVMVCIWLAQYAVNYPDIKRSVWFNFFSIFYCCLIALEYLTKTKTNTPTVRWIQKLSSIKVNRVIRH